MPAGGKGKKKYILQVTTYQMGVLLLLNDAPTIKLRDLQAQSQLQDVLLRASLNALVQKKVLVATDAADAWTENTEFSSNPKFTRFTRSPAAARVAASATASLTRSALALPTARGSGSTASRLLPWHGKAPRSRALPTTRRSRVIAC
jgi:hypothetical protein